MPGMGYGLIGLENVLVHSTISKQMAILLAHLKPSAVSIVSLKPMTSNGSPLITLVMCTANVASTGTRRGTSDIA